jgi:hypothetical protein
MRPTTLRCLQKVLLIVAFAGMPPAVAGGNLVFNDGFNTGDSCAWSLGPSSCLGAGFQIDTPEVLIGPGEEITYCYYFETPNAESIGVKRWALTLGSVAHDVTLYATYDNAQNPAPRQADGTLSAVDCGFTDSAATSTVANWLYAGHDTFSELVLPGDDGAGNPLAVEVPAGAPMFLEMHFINPTGSQIANTVRLDAEALAIGTTYTETASYYTYNNSLSIPPGAAGDTETRTCAVPAGVEFWFLTTRTHLHASLATVRDGANPLVQSSNWEQPAIQQFPPPSAYTFSASGMTYECVYDNPSASTITSGNDPQTDENCVGIGYFFPATRPLLCFNNVGPL